MTKKLVFPRRVEAAHRPDIVLIPVGVTGMEVQDEVIDEVIEIEILLDGREVAGLGCREDGLPTVEHAGIDLGRSAFDDFDVVAAHDAEAFPIVIPTAEALGGPFFLNPFEEVVDSEIESVEVNMDFALQGFGVAHFKARIMVCDTQS